MKLIYRVALVSNAKRQRHEHTEAKVDLNKKLTKTREENDRKMKDTNEKQVDMSEEQTQDDKNKKRETGQNRKRKNS